jgi:hypothetical protein
MELTETQKRLVKMIGNRLYSVATCEKYYKEKVSCARAYDMEMHVRINAFMEAVDGIIAIIDKGY